MSKDFLLIAKRNKQIIWMKKNKIVTKNGTAMLENMLKRRERRRRRSKASFRIILSIEILYSINRYSQESMAFLIVKNDLAELQDPRKNHVP